MNVLRYAVRSAILPSERVYALDVAGEVSVHMGGPAGLMLEYQAIQRAVYLAQQQGLESLEVVISSGLAAAVLEDSSLPVVGALAGLVTEHGLGLSTGEAPQGLLDLLGAHLPAPVEWEIGTEDREWVEKVGATVVYTDGSCTTTLSLGAWSWYVDESRHAAGGVPSVTQSMGAEQWAIMEAVKALGTPLLVLSDCESVVRGHDPHLRDTALLEFMEELRCSDRVRVRHVLGHTTSVGNQRAHTLAHTALWVERKRLRKDPEGLRAMEVEASHASLPAAWLEKARTKNSWCKARRRQLLDLKHPGWEGLPASERKRLGTPIYFRVAKEWEDLQKAGLLEGVL